MCPEETHKGSVAGRQVQTQNFVAVICHTGRWLSSVVKEITDMKDFYLNFFFVLP